MPESAKTTERTARRPTTGRARAGRGSPVRRRATAVLAAALAGGGTLTPLAAQTPEREPAVTELPASARAVALGGAFQLGANDPDLLFANPALLERVRGMALGFHVLGGESLAGTLSAAAEGFGGGVGAGLQVLEYGRGAGPRAGGLDPLLGEGPRAIAELVGSVGYGREIFDVRVGVAAKLVAQRVGSLREVGFAADVGASRDFEGVTVGVALQDLKASGDGVGPLPTRVTVGAGRYAWQVGPLDVGGAAALTVRDDGEVVPGGGIEVGYYPVTGRTFVARLGARRVPEGEALPLTFGGSYWGDNLVLDYAFQAVDGADGVHRATIGWR